jgi:uncharacterized membrane protein SpoIIM required for sporulation/uncharacterized RDD family membrane protein YckC
MPRALAYIIDWLIRGAILLVVAIVLSIFGEIGVGLLLVFLFVLDWGYGGLLEWLYKGATPGKRALGIRVIGVDGLPAGLGACFLRNIMRLADALPVAVVLGIPLFLTGLGSMVAFRGFQRLGDLAAGTLVIYDERRSVRKLPRFQDSRLERRANELPPDVLDRIDAKTMRAITAFIGRRRVLSQGRRNEIAAHLSGPLQEALAITGRWGSDELLCAIYLRGYQGKDDRGAAKAAAILRSRAESWKRLENLVDASPSASAAPEVAWELSHQYRSACADLAIADAYQLPQQQVSYLHDLVARAHLSFYRRLVLPVRTLVEHALVRVPGMLYGDPGLRIALFTFYGLGVSAALLAYHQPDVAVNFVGEDAVADMLDMYADPVNDRDLGGGSMMGGFYIFNNVGIALTCFASGIFLGIGSVVYLAYNALYLGLIFGYMGTADPEPKAHFFEFVAAHGPFELTGIALAGAAGLRLGMGLVATGGRPWRESIQEAGLQSFRIMAVAAVFVGLAAPIEGFVSPSALPLWAKRSAGVLCAAFLVFYLIVLGHRGRRILAAEEAST